MAKLRGSRINEPSSWASLSAALFGFAAMPEAVIGVASVPWQLRAAAFFGGCACAAIGILMREWPNK